jgi:anti-sigma regulatory factor (Ser/Thr protein kinase)
MMTDVIEPLRLNLEADAKALAPLRQAVREWLHEVGADNVHDVVLAVDEAVANAIEHAGLASAALITVELDVRDQTLHMLVSDHGVWKEQALEESRGRGLLIMHAVMDNVTVEHRSDETRLVMSRQLRRT